MQVGGRANVHGIACNVSSPGAVKRLADAAASQMGSVDVWINNAGYSGRYQVSFFLHCALLLGKMYHTQPSALMSLDNVHITLKSLGRIKTGRTSKVVGMGTWQNMLWMVS